MTSPQGSPKHYILRSGKLSQKVHDSRSPTPKTIHYTHTVRMFTPFECGHESQILKIKQKHKVEIQQKNNQINKLLKIVEQKQSLLMDKENLIVRLQQSQRKSILKTNYSDSKYENSRVSSKSNFNPENHIIWSSVSKHQIEQLYPDAPEIELTETKVRTDQQILKVKEQMKNTIDALSNITNLLQKPRRKYKFYFEDFQIKDHKKQGISSEKRLSETTIHHFQEESLNQTFIQSIDNEQNYNDQLSSVDLDPDQTSADECPDTQTFLEDVINEHRVLRKTLIDLEQSTNKQMEDLKAYHQKQIRMYVQLLNSQKPQNQKFKIDSARTNLSSEENNRWDYYSNYEQSQNQSEKDVQDKPLDDQRQYPPDYQNY